jgi:hypothetical protein
LFAYYQMFVRREQADIILHGGVVLEADIPLRYVRIELVVVSPAEYYVLVYVFNVLPKNSRTRIVDIVRNWVG